MIDVNILRFMKVKENYDRIMPALPKDALEQSTRIIIEDFGRFFKETGHPVVKIPAAGFFFVCVVVPKDAF